LTEYKLLTLSSLGGGAVEEMFQEELFRVLKNIADPNTPAEVVREIRLQVKIKPNKAREVGGVVVVPSSKLAPMRHFDTTIYMGRHKGLLIAHEDNPKQLSFQNMDHVVGIEKEVENGS
jgi:hypothetical protein